MEEENLKKKENNVTVEKSNNDVSKSKKSKKIIFVIIGILLIIGIGIFVWLYFFKYSDRVLTFYRYNNSLLLDKSGVVEDLNYKDLKKYTYKCKSKNCSVVGNFNKVGVDSRNDWVLIDDANNGPEYGSGSIMTGTATGVYTLYNVETEDKIKVSFNKAAAVGDIFLDENNKPIGIIVNADSMYVMDIKTGKKLLDINDIVYGSEIYRILKIVNNGYRDFYMFESINYSNKLLYDENLNYVRDILSTDYFDNDGNIIETYQNEKTYKMYFKVFDLKGNELRTSKTYDNISIDNGYLIVQDNGVVSIIDSKEQKLVEISKLGKKYEYTTEYNQYYYDYVGVSVFEVQNPNSEKSKKVTQYIYNPKNKKLDKIAMSFDGYSEPYAALSRFCSNGYQTFKYNNVTLYLDNDLSDSKKENFKSEMNNLFNNKITKRLFNAKQNVYMLTKYDSERMQDLNYISYDSTSIAYYSYYSGMIFDTSRIVRMLAVNYYKENQQKLNNSAFRNIYDKYYSYFGDGFHITGSYTNSYGEEGFFGVIMASYYISENNMSYGYIDETETTRNKIANEGKIEDFDKLVKKYVESYVLK